MAEPSKANINVVSEAIQTLKDVDKVKVRPGIWIARKVVGLPVVLKGNLDLIPGADDKPKTAEIAKNDLVGAIKNGPVDVSSRVSNVPYHSFSRTV